MRPIERGIPPSKTFTHYSEAADSLIARLGSYCSYCERRLETHLAVEHIIPKSVNPQLENDWNNFLLGCVNCNSSKGATQINVLDYFWPHADDTIKVFSYINGMVGVAPGLNEKNKKKAESLIRLVGLDKDPGNPDIARRPTQRDKRWIFRNQLWGVATEALKCLREYDSLGVRDLIVKNALSRGGFGIWLTVFSEDEDMRRRLINAFPGTAKYYFGKFARLEIPVHVLRLLTVIAEEIKASHGEYDMQVVLPKADNYQRSKISLTFRERSEDNASQKIALQLSDRSVWVSMSEYPPIQSVSKNKITIIVFEQRQENPYSITKTRHYVEPSYEGGDVAAITFRNMCFAAKDICNFLLFGMVDIGQIG